MSHQDPVESGQLLEAGGVDPGIDQQSSCQGLKQHAGLTEVDDLHGVPLLATGRHLQGQRATGRPRAGSLASVPRVIVDVVPKPEILDPQGQAIVRALPRLGVHGVRDVRQGKHFELDVDDDVDTETLHRIAGELLANPVIEDWTVRRL